MLIPHPYRLIPVPLPCSLTGDQTLPAIPYISSSTARWVGGHVPNGGEEQAGEHTLPALPWYRHSRDPWYCQGSGQRGSEGRTGMWVQTIPPVTGVSASPKGCQCTLPIILPSSFIALRCQSPTEEPAYKWEQISCPGRVLYAI